MMDHNKINEEAWKYSVNVLGRYAASRDYKDTQHAFTAGVHFAAENPSVIGCVTVEEAMMFAEWVHKQEEWSGYNGLWSNSILGPYKTTAELFDIYKQQKP